MQKFKYLKKIKLGIFLVYPLLSCLICYGQSNTYQIEQLSRPEKLLPTVPADKLFSTVKKDFLKFSLSEEMVDLGTRPVITGYLRAYQNHYPITISPDIAWLLICQGFSRHVSSNPEAMRELLVDFKEKKELIVKRNIINLKDFSKFPWETIFPEFVQQISTYTGQELTHNLKADFTTTTAASLIAGQITIMESMKEFFNYKVILMGCGIPEVTVEGSAEDWEKISSRLDYLARFDLKWWTSELKPVIQKIIDTKKGNLDKQFWMNMVKYHKTGVYGSYDGIDGWLLKFYPYLEGKAIPLAQNIARPANFKSTDVISISLPDPNNRTISYTRSNFKEISNVGVLPKEMACVPFILEVQDGSSKIIGSYNMEFWAGFMGVKQDKTTFSVKPEIGWAVNRVGEL